MLILTRRIGETLMIGGDVQITVLALKGRQVRLGIRAPPTIAVHREEVFDRIQHERDAVTQSRSRRRPEEPGRC